MGAQEVLLNLALKSSMMHMLITRVVDVYNKILSQYESEGLLGSNNSNWRIGSGAYGYTSEVPENSESLRIPDIWGSASPQLFGSVSPSMNEKFAIHYELKWLERFGLSYYGCCEPLLSKRIDLLAKYLTFEKYL